MGNLIEAKLVSFLLLLTYFQASVVKTYKSINLKRYLIIINNKSKMWWYISSTIQHFNKSSNEMVAILARPRSRVHPCISEPRSDSSLFYKEFRQLGTQCTNTPEMSFIHQMNRIVVLINLREIIVRFINPFGSYFIQKCLDLAPYFDSLLFVNSRRTNFSSGFGKSSDK